MVVANSARIAVSHKCNSFLKGKTGHKKRRRVATAPRLDGLEAV
jgi:hypothetical protein